MQKQKVLFFLPGGVGGAERMTLTIAKFLPLNDFDVKFIIVGTEKDIYNFIPKEYSIDCIPVHNIYCAATLRIWNKIRKEKPDFTFCSTMYLNIRVLTASKLAGVKCIVRNDNTITNTSSLNRLWLKKAYPHAYRIIAQQEEMNEEIVNYTGIDKDKVVTLHNPLDKTTIDEKIKEASPYPPEDIIKYLWVANYLPTKGHDILAEAFAIVHNKNPKAHLYFVGNIVESFPNYIKTKNIVAQYGLEKCVHFVGYQSNPYKWMKYCDCFVLPSRLEGLPNVLLEAMYLKKPVVASTCIPVIERMVEEGYNGYKVKPEQPKEMAEAMVKALRLQDFELCFPTATTRDFIELFK